VELIPLPTSSSRRNCHPPACLRRQACSEEICASAMRKLERVEHNARITTVKKIISRSLFSHAPWRLVHTLTLQCDLPTTKISPSVRCHSLRRSGHPSSTFTESNAFIPRTIAASL
jgi:hypothetical protein